MARDWQIYGECLITVRGGGHMSGYPIAKVSELGLSSEEITVTPHFAFRDVHIDDFGPDVPAEVHAMLAWVNVRVPLVHYDRDVLNVCIRESMGGGLGGQVATAPLPGGIGGRLTDPLVGGEGILAGAGTPLGGGRPMFASGNHLISLNIDNQLFDPDDRITNYRFRSCHLTGQPLELRLGTTKTVAITDWRCIPYAPLPFYPTGQFSGLINVSGEQASRGTVLWDHRIDLPTDG